MQMDVPLQVTGFVNMLINIMEWKCNREFEKSFHAFERGPENFLRITGGSWKFYHHDHQLADLVMAWLP